jgi:hypothetical protein
VHRDRVQPVGAVMTTDGTRGFVALGPANHIAAVDMKTLDVEAYTLLGCRAWHMEMTPDETLLFTTNGLSGDMTVVVVARLKPIEVIKVGRFA